MAAWGAHKRILRFIVHPLQSTAHGPVPDSFLIQRVSAKCTSSPKVSVSEPAPACHLSGLYIVWYIVLP